MSVCLTKCETNCMLRERDDDNNDEGVGGGVINFRVGSIGSKILKCSAQTVVQCHGCSSTV